MNPRPVYRRRWMLSLFLMLSVALAVQGVPTARSGKIPKSGGSPMTEDPSQSKKLARGAEIPLLPPDEDLGTDEGVHPLELADYEDDRISGMGGVEVSGDDSADITYFSGPIPFKKPKTQINDNQGNDE